LNAFATQKPIRGFQPMRSRPVPTEFRQEPDVAGLASGGR
jgi:hypothetical protein